MLGPPVISQNCGWIQMQVTLHTSAGDITLALRADKAPLTVDNFLSYAKKGHYDGTIFHRVIKNFMIQGGGLTSDFQAKPTAPPIRNEADNGLSNLTGTISMARRGDPHSATAQFFINTEDNLFLDHRAPTPEGWGYCVFGAVVTGMDVVEAIESGATTSHGVHQDAPVTPVMIRSVEIQEG